MKDGNRIKAEQLGMSPGKARNKLIKMILFDMAKKCGMSKCIRCNKEIESNEDLSIDHIKPWLHESTDLFWDLDNIAFSHLSCNCKAARKRKKINRQHLRRITPDGTAWCNKCEDFILIENFYKDRRRWNGVQSTCIQCHKNRDRKTKPRGLVTR